MSNTFTRCEVCSRFVFTANSTWRCRRCFTLHVPGWDDSPSPSPSQSQEPDKPSPLRGILHGFLLGMVSPLRGILHGFLLALAIWAVLMGVYALFGGAS